LKVRSLLSGTKARGIRMVRKKFRTTISSPRSSTGVSAALIALRQPTVRNAAEIGERLRSRVETEAPARTIR
jgi:hypothetical protein